MAEFEEFFDETILDKTKLQKADVSNDKIIVIMGTKEKKAASTTDTDLEEQRNIGRNISRVVSFEKQSEPPQLLQKKGINMGGEDCFKSLCPQFIFYNGTVSFGNQQTFSNSLRTTQVILFGISSIGIILFHLSISL